MSRAYLNATESPDQSNQNGAGKWQCHIQKDYLGLFDSEETAARAYNEEAKKRFGEFARLNLTN